MYILGLNAYHGDSSACLIKDGELIAAAEEERFRRIKHWAGFPLEAIRYCLNEENIEIEDLDYIAINRNPKVNLYRKIIFTLFKHPNFSLIKSRLSNAWRINDIKNTISRKFQISKDRIKARFYNVEHHRAHLASSFLCSPFDDACLISLDGFGDFVSTMVGVGNRNKIDVLWEINYPHSLGLFYTAFTQFLGFDKYGDEYKVMGLSAFGSPVYLDKMEKIVILESEGKFRLNLDYFSHHKKGDSMLWNDQAPVLGRVYSDKLIEVFGIPRSYGEDISNYYKDIAASVQAMYEKVFFHILNYAYKETKSPNLCVSGGCGLNSLANGKVFDHTPFKELYIPPAPHDGGGALGAAYYVYHQILDYSRNFIMQHPYWGPGFSCEEISEELKSKRLESCKVEKLENEDGLCKKIAEYIADGKIVGWFQGKMEWGPRALGNRSILADPRRKDMKDTLNKRIKKREAFRPFAPSILEEYVGEYFEKDYPNPFMVKIYPIKKDKQDIIPAVTHIDGTGRLQTVSKKENYLYWRLIEEFRRKTGVPVLLNTSFNENEPIVCSPEEALDCFLRTEMDILVLDSFILKRENR